jgi:hypothetical protein
MYGVKSTEYGAQAMLPGSVKIFVNVVPPFVEIFTLADSVTFCHVFPKKNASNVNEAPVYPTKLNTADFRSTLAWVQLQASSLIHAN